LLTRRDRAILFPVMPSGPSITELLQDWRAGDRGALDALIPLVYAELRRLADSYLRRERPNHTFRPTDLVGEAYVRLAGTQFDIRDRAHFLAVAARLMRQILVDHARRSTASKRGSGERPITLDDRLVVIARPDAFIELDQALDALASFDGRKAQAVELHYFGGLTHDEIAAVLGVHVNTVANDLRLAEAWLHRQLATLA
jgi:RNA polymerase sigma factor (TIGR02999 family)